MAIPKTVFFIVIPVAIILNIVLILTGYYFWVAGMTEIAIILWVITPIMDIFIILGTIWGIKFHNAVVTNALPNPACLLFGGIIVAAIIIASVVNIVL